MTKTNESIKNENEYKFMDKFIPINEISSYYKSKIDYRKIFNDLDINTKNNLYEISNKIYNLKVKDNISDNIYFMVDGVDSIDSIPCSIKMYITRFYYNDEDEDDNDETRIGILISAKEELNERLLQHFFYSNLNFLKIKDYIYNILFFAHIIVKTFKASPLLYHLYHKDDIEDMNNIRKINIQLFGNQNDCCVCYDNTVFKLACSHSLCQKCYLKLSYKKCPMCRVDLINEYNGAIYLY